MGRRHIFGAGLGVGFVVARFWRTLFKSRVQKSESAQPSPAQTDPDSDPHGMWVEFDVEPLFASSEPVAQEYLIDLTESSETESDRPV